MMKIHIYVKNRNGNGNKIQRAEIDIDGVTIRLDPKKDLIFDRSGRLIAFRNPIFNVTLPLHSYFVIYHKQ